MAEYAEALAALRDAGVRFLIVGSFGVNLHADTKGPIVFTEDCDALLPPDATNLALAIRTLRNFGCEIEAGDEPLIDEDELTMHGIVRNRACVRARTPRLAFDFPLQIAGTEFDSAWSRRCHFTLEGVDVPVGDLQDLLESKRLANRPKDRLFLETYRSELEELARRDRTQRNRKRRSQDKDRDRP